MWATCAEAFGLSRSKTENKRISLGGSREGADDLTLKAEEVDTLNACINVDHIGKDWGPPLVDADWHAFCKEIFDGIDGSEWEELYYHYREMSKAAGTRKLSESQKAKALRAMNSAKDREEDFDDPARMDNIFGRCQTRQELWKEHLKENVVALDKALKYLEHQYQS